jgi:hypothetical protein
VYRGYAEFQTISYTGNWGSANASSRQFVQKAENLTDEIAGKLKKLRDLKDQGKI